MSLIPILVSIDEESSIIINKGGDSPGGGAPTGTVLDPDGESILNIEKGGLKANGVQEGSEGVSLFAPSSHVWWATSCPRQNRGEGPPPDCSTVVVTGYWNQWKSSGANSAKPVRATF